MKLTRDFFLRNTLDVAKDLIGTKLVFFNYSGIITEVESYIGEDDPACHCANGKTKRNSIMYKAGGYSYIYLIYGIHCCLNITTEANDYPAAILIRGLLVSPNHNYQDLNNKNNILLNGPGKLCKYLGINREYNNMDITSNNNFYLEETNIKLKFTTTPRIGISKGVDKLWRYAVDLNDL